MESVGQKQGESRGPSVVPSDGPGKSLLICPSCHDVLAPRDEALRCSKCEVAYPVEHGIADFSGGLYYDDFPGEEALSAEHREGLENEIPGVTRRIRDFYLPLIAATFPERRRPIRVLDSGCGNGLSVDLLIEAGLEAWGNDISALRKWQWRERSNPQRLVVADSKALPFPDGCFDVVLSSGVIEHIGVEEGHENGRYWVRPKPERDKLRRRFLHSLVRVLAKDGCLFLDCPNGAFPIDFWHGNSPGAARFHSRSEGFLATAEEIRRHVEPLGRGVHGLSPRGRLKMAQVGGHWYGRLFRLPMEAFLRMMDMPALRGLTTSFANPYLVLKIS